MVGGELVGGSSMVVTSSTYLMVEWKKFAAAVLVQAAKDARTAARGDAIRRVEWTGEKAGWAKSTEIAAAVEGFSHSGLAVVCCEMIGMSAQNYGYNLRRVLKDGKSRLAGGVDKMSHLV